MHNIVQTKIFIIILVIGSICFGFFLFDKISIVDDYLYSHRVVKKMAKDDHIIIVLITDKTVEEYHQETRDSDRFS
ncbi:MAG: hypothetical protein EPN22_14970 [Nitrospirae bacterium]|nr:MAG: hypothetical protein EPN22_14970 [Nitrospirota bacterium]